MTRGMHVKIHEKNRTLHNESASTQTIAYDNINHNWNHTKNITDIKFGAVTPLNSTRQATNDGNNNNHNHQQQQQYNMFIVSVTCSRESVE